MSLAAGQRLGQYEILAELGKGGMGEVYRGKDTLADRIADGPIAFADAVLIASQIADALEAAHEQGVALVRGTKREGEVMLRGHFHGA